MSEHETRESTTGEGTGLSAVAVPLLALGMLGAAIYFGSAPPRKPAPLAATAPKAAAAAVDPLPSWNDGETKRAILDFVAAVTREGADTFVPPAERVAVFDNDGTLVCEKPIAHGAYLIERIRALVEKQPELAHEEPFASLVNGDLEMIRRLGRKFFMDLTYSTIAGVPEEQLEADVQAFLETTRHPTFDAAWGDTTYQPMRELMQLLRAKGFTVWICSGSGVHFMRPAAAAWYGVGPEHVIASRPRTTLAEHAAGDAADDGPNRGLHLLVHPELEVLNDQESKPVSIGERIGRRPIFAAGNVGTAGDVAMLRWSQSGRRPSLQLLVLHDDAQREMAYGEPAGQSLSAAEKYGWHVVSMARDWREVFAKPLVKREAATEPPPASVPTPVATEPPPAPEPPPAAATSRWDEELAAYAEADVHPPQPGGVVLLGSSNIRMWNTLADDFPGMEVTNRGVGGCRLTELAEFGPRLVAAAAPRVIVVSAGTNDIADGLSTPEIVAAFEGLVAALREAQPQATIVFLAVAPSIKRWEQRERQAEVNAAIRDAITARAEAVVEYLDTNAALMGSDGMPAAECFLDDLQHPSTIGNARRAALLRPVLMRLLEPAAVSSGPPSAAEPPVAPEPTPEPAAPATETEPVPAAVLEPVP